MIKKILVPIDGSKQSEKALDYALDLAEKYSAKIKLLTVVEPVIFSGPLLITEPVLMPEGQIEIEKSIEKAHENMLDDVFKKAKKSHSNLEIKKQQVVGRPADEIVEIANNENFDLIVMGSRGRGKIKEFFLGSVSDRVADEAVCPVLIVKKMKK